MDVIFSQEVIIVTALVAVGIGVVAAVASCATGQNESIYDRKVRELREGSSAGRGGISNFHLPGVKRSEQQVCLNEPV